MAKEIHTNQSIPNIYNRDPKLIFSNLFHLIEKNSIIMYITLFTVFFMYFSLLISDLILRSNQSWSIYPQD